MLDYLIYLGIPLILIIYFDFFGKAILNILKIKDKIFAFPIGFFVYLVACYLTTSYLTSLYVSYYLVFFIYAFLFVISLIVTIKNNDFKIDYDKKELLLLLISAFFLTYYSLKTTLGSLHGFDSLHYLNMVTSNIDVDRLNSFETTWGNAVERNNWSYSFQTYYYLSSVVTSLIQKLLSLVSFNYYSSIGFIWIFQVFYNFAYSALIIDSIKILKIKNVTQILFVVLLLIGFYARWYFNNAFGFFGNTFRTLSIAYSGMFLYLFLNKKKDRYKYLFYICILSSCAFSSSSAFNVMLYLFAVFFVLIDFDSNIFKEYSFICFFSISNMLLVFLGWINVKNTIISIILSTFLFIFNDKLVEIFKNINCRKALILITSLTFFLLSRKVSNGLLDFSSFFNNLGTLYDMTLFFNSLSFNNGLSISEYYIIISTLLFIFFMIKNYKNNFSIIFIILIICFFNPFCCGYLNHENPVYYRAYEIMINPFTILMFFSYLIGYIKNRYVSNAILISMSLFLFSFIDVSKPIYYHSSFIPEDNYNEIYKMTNSQLEIINELKLHTLNNDNPYILTDNLLTQSMLQKGHYVYGRGLIISPWNCEENDEVIFSIFYPEEYYGEYKDTISYDKNSLNDYISKSDLDYLVVNKNKDYYDEEQDIYYSINYLVLECNNCGLLFENDDYALYSINK